MLELKNVLYKDLYKTEPLDREEIYGKLMEDRAALAPYVADTFTLLHEAVKADDSARGPARLLKDPTRHLPDGHLLLAARRLRRDRRGGVPPYAIQEIVTVVKAYSSGRRG